MLKLLRPLVIYDLETTGTNPVTDRIVEISTLKIFPDGTEEIKTKRLNPECAIPSGASAVHKIKDEDVADLPCFRHIAKALLAYLANCDLCTFNGNRFDVPLLAEEFARVNLDFPGPDVAHVDVSDIYRQLHPRTLSAAVAHYLGQEHATAHSAEGDTAVTFALLQAMIQGPLTTFISQKSDVTLETFFCPAGLSAFGDGEHHGRARVLRVDPSGKLVRNEVGSIVWGFGPHAGIPVAQTEPGFINWVLNKDFPVTTKRALQRIVEGALL